jgi:hypothetical protein
MRLQIFNFGVHLLRTGSLHHHQSQSIRRCMSSLKPSDVELTSVRYKDQVQRGQYAKLEPEDVAFFRDFLGKNRVITDSDDLASHNVDWLRMVRGKIINP